MSNEYNLGQVRFKNLTDTSKMFECPMTPSSIVRTACAREESEIARRYPGFYQAYYSAKRAGILGSMGIQVTDSVDDDVLELFDSYAMTVDMLDDDGNVMEEDVEVVEEVPVPDPTGASEQR